MKSKLLGSQPQETWALVFDAGDEVPAKLLEFAKQNHISGASLNGLGTFSEVTLGYFDLALKDYRAIPVHEQVEVVSLVGNIALFNGEPRVHAHVVIARRDGAALGGHLLQARVRPTLELVLVELPGKLERSHDESTGLSLLRL